MARSIDHVEIPLSRETIELPWASRNALLDEFRHLDSMQPIIKEFEDAGTSRAIRLTRVQKADLIQVIEHWGSQSPGGLTDGLPEGIFRLRNALHDDLHDQPSD